MEDTFCVCTCYFTHNIFLQRYDLHCTFLDDEQFREDYEEVLRERGCTAEQDYEDVLKQVHCEVERRRNGSKQSMLRSQTIKLGYQPCHPEVYTLSDRYLQAEFKELVEYCKSPRATLDGLLDRITEEDIPNVYSFPVFTAEFCDLLLRELDHFERSDMPKERPNTMNNYGILLSELGFDKGFLDRLRRDHLQPVASLLYPEWMGSSGLDSHKAFTVGYEVEGGGGGGDRDLAYHYDNAEVTLNVCLGSSFTGGELSFGPMAGEPGSLWKQRYSHRIGRGLLHRGRHQHQAHSITSGKRVNLIVWMRSSSIRNRQCPMCGEVPSLAPCEGYGDGFTAVNDDTSEQNISMCQIL